MTDPVHAASAAAPVRPPVYRAARLNDVTASLAAGFADFRAQPVFGLFFGGVYALAGLAILWLLSRAGAGWMIIPMAIGFPLVGPFVAVGLYEISRRIAVGEQVTWAGVLSQVYLQKERQLGWMAFVVLFIFWIWVYQARLLFALFLGHKSFVSSSAFLHMVTSTTEGLTFLVVGSLVGAVLAAILFATTFLSLPLLMERDVDVVSAMIASVSAVTRAPVATLAFGAVAGGLTLLSMVPGFLGLFIVLPVLGHATWHFHARLKVPE